jgi:hypothetical protein
MHRVRTSEGHRANLLCPNLIACARFRRSLARRQLVWGLRSKQSLDVHRLAAYTSAPGTQWASAMLLSGAHMRLLRRLALPASESQLALALALCLVVMSLLLFAVMWQSGVIDYQRELIRLLWNSTHGG